MGMMFGEVTFDGQAPGLGEICRKISAMTSLDIIVKEDRQERQDSDLHRLNAKIAFTCFPETELQLLVYRAGAVAGSCDAMFDEPGYRRVMKQVVQGADEPEGTETVYLRGYLGQEPTLMIATNLALCELGGRSPAQFTEAERREFGGALTEEELGRRHQQAVSGQQRATWMFLLLLPLTIPLWIAGCVWGLVTMPYRIWMAVRVVRQLEREGESGEHGTVGPTH